MKYCYQLAIIIEVSMKLQASAAANLTVVFNYEARNQRDSFHKQNAYQIRNQRDSFRKQNAYQKHFLRWATWPANFLKQTYIGKDSIEAVSFCDIRLYFLEACANVLPDNQQIHCYYYNSCNSCNLIIHI